MKITTLYYLSMSALFALQSCSKKQADKVTEVSDFTLSDTMLSKCEFSMVKTQKVKDALSLFGKIQADNNKLAHVEPIVGGNVLKINVELGDYVRQVKY